MKLGEFRILVASLGVAALTLQGCGKYEDGPAISLRTKNSRLTGEWKLVDDNNGGWIDDETEMVFEFQDDGDFKMSVTYTYEYYGQTQTYSYSYLGEWEWLSGKETVLINMDNDLITLNILKLTSEELSTEYIYGSNVQEWHFEKQ